MRSRPMCPHTHSLLYSGICPWCQQPIVEGEVRPNLAMEAVAVRRWNVQAMIGTLGNQDAGVRRRTITDLLLHGPPVAEVLPVLSTTALVDLNRIS
jgi:hypothetical protein